MQFFTVDWWRGMQDGNVIDPVAAYSDHFRQIRDQLPPDLACLSETVSLHDSRLRSLSLNSATHTLHMLLAGDDGIGGRRTFKLTYQHVRSFQSFSDPDVGLSGPHGYGDLGYDESHILPDGLFEHRILFSTGIEFRIAFADFSMTFKDDGDG